VTILFNYSKQLTDKKFISTFLNQFTRQHKIKHLYCGNMLLSSVNTTKHMNRTQTFVYFFFFFSGMHHQKCIVPKVDISLQSGRFWAMSIASFRETLLDLDFTSCWIIFIHVVRGHSGGLLQFSKGEAVKIFLATWHLCNVAEQGEMLCFDNSRNVWLPGCLSHITIIYWPCFIVK